MPLSILSVAISYLPAIRSRHSRPLAGGFRRCLSAITYYFTFLMIFDDVDALRGPAGIAKRHEQMNAQKCLLRAAAMPRRAHIYEHTAATRLRTKIR